MEPMSRCIIGNSECVSGRLKLGMCEKHYRRHRVTGTTDTPFIDNWTQYIVDDDGCWRWQGALHPNGYGKMSRPFFGTRLAHRAFYIEKHGPLERRIDLDHLCRVRDCVNPSHLEPCTRSTNLRRGAGSYEGTKKMCRRQLHDTTLPGALRVNSDGGRECVECWRIRYRAAGQRYRDRLNEEGH